MAESYSVTAKLSAQDKNFSSTFRSAQGAADSLAGRLKSGLGFGVLAGIGMKAATMVTGAVRNMAAGVIDAGKTFDASMSQVAATMGTSVEEIQDLRSFAQEMGATTAFSATQAADALNYMALAGYDSEKSMQMLPNVLNLAAAGGMELARASDMVTDAQSALGLSTDETKTMVDQMAKTASKSNTSVSQLGDAILTIGATARGVKGGTTELNTLLGVLADNGIKGAEGGTHLRNILLSLQNPTDTAADALKKLGVSVYDSEGKMRSTVDIIADMKKGMAGMSQESKDALISGIFNKTDLASVNALLNTSEDRFNELAGSIEDCTGAAEQMANTQLDNLQGDVTLFQSALEGLQIAIFDKFQGPMRSAVQTATKGLTKATELVGKLGDVFDGSLKPEEIAAKGTDAVAGFLGSIASGIPGAVQSGTDILTGVVRGVAVSSPNLMRKAVELVGTMAVSFASAAPQMLMAGVTLLVALAHGVGTSLPMLASYAMNAVMTFAQGIIGNLPRILAAAYSIVSSLVSGILQTLPVIIRSGIQLIVYLVKSLIANLPLIIQTAIRMVGSLVKGLLAARGMLAQGAVDLVTALIDTIIHTDWLKVGRDVITSIGDGIKSGFSGVGDLINGLFSGDTSAAEGAAQQASAAAESTAQAYLESSSYIADAASQVGAEAQASLVDSLDDGALDVESIFSSMGTEGSTAFADAMTGIDLSGIGAEAATTVTGEFDTGLAELPGITDTAGSQVVSSLEQTGKQAATSAKNTTTNVIKALRAGVNPAKAAGKAVGSGYAGGLRGESANASSAGSAVKNSALSGMSGGYGSAYSHGSNIGQGLVDGMRSKIGAAWAAANELAAAADKAIHARAQIGSPSKITIKYGGWIAEGLAVGIKSGANGVVKQAKKLVTTLYKQMQKSTKKLGGAKDAASTYLKTFKTSLQNKAKSDLEYVENSLKKYRDASKSYNEAITALMKSYKTAYNREVDKLISSVNTKLTNLANTYQTKYNKIIDAQKDFRDALRETSLYSTDEYGNIALTNFASQNRAIKQYAANINKLKKLLPESMMDEILGMSRANGLAYTTELLKKSTAEIKAYGKQYSVVMGTSSKVASSYYSGRLTALQKSYAADLKKIYADAQKDMDGIGKNVVQGLIDGMKSKKGALDAAGKSLAKAVEDAFKKQLGIHSPSTVMTDAGEDTGQGVINGIENKIRAARAAMAELLDVTSPETEIRRRSGDMNLNDEYDYRTEAEYTIIVESTLDGKKVGEGTAKYVKYRNDAVERRENRKKGKT